jgi:hypothetical protein
MSSKSKTKGKIPTIASKPVIAGGIITKPKIPAPTPAVSPPPANTSGELEDEPPGELAELEGGGPKKANPAAADYHARKAGFQAELADLLEKWGFTREAFRTRNPRRAPR